MDPAELLGQLMYMSLNNWFTSSWFLALVVIGPEYSGSIALGIVGLIFLS
jgi:hypothetical protein